MKREASARTAAVAAKKKLKRFQGKLTQKEEELTTTKTELATARENEKAAVQE